MNELSGCNLQKINVLQSGFEMETELEQLGQVVPPKLGVDLKPWNERALISSFELGKTSPAHFMTILTRSQRRDVVPILHDEGMRESSKYKRKLMYIHL